MKVLSHKLYKKPGQGYSLNGCLHLVTKSLQHQKFRLRNIKDQQKLSIVKSGSLLQLLNKENPPLKNGGFFRQEGESLV